MFYEDLGNVILVDELKVLDEYGRKDEEFFSEDLGGQTLIREFGDTSS